MPGVADGQLVQHRDPERLQVLLQDLLQRLGPGPLGALLAPVAPGHVADGHPGDPGQLAGLLQLGEHPVDVPGRRVDLLEEQDRPLQLELPWRAHGLEQQPQVAAGQGPGGPAAADRPEEGVVGVGRHRAGAVAPQRGQQPVAGEVAGLGPAHGHQVGAVEGGQPGQLAQGDVQGGDVGVAQEGLGVLGDQLEVEVGDQLHRPEPAGQALDHVDLGVGEHRLQVASPALGVAGHVAVPGLDPVGQLHPVPPGLPPLDPPQQVRAALPGARRRRHADTAPVGQLPAEPGRLDHTGHRPTPRPGPRQRRRLPGVRNWRGWAVPR